MSGNEYIDTNKAETADILQAVLENTTDNIVVIDANHKVICFNDLARNVLARIHKKQLTKGDDYKDFVAAENRELYLQAFSKAIRGKTTLIEKEIDIEGEKIWFQLKLNPVYTKSDNLLGVAFTATNTDQRKKKEIALEQSLEKINKGNRELALLNKINDIILLAENEQTLYQVVCKCIVESGGYTLAWLCHYPEEATNKSAVIIPLASSGAVGYLNSITISLKDTKQSKGPTATALINNKKVITNNFHRSENFNPWLEQAGKFGISSSLVLPIDTGRGKPGALNIYSGNIDAFDNDEVTILERLANNLSLAVKNIRNRNEILYTRHQLNERIKELSTIYQLHTILQDEKQSLEAVFTRIVNILPPGWQYQEICAAKIEFDGKEYVTANYRPSAYKQQAAIKTQDGRTGTIEVIYTEKKPSEAEGPFLQEERNLINTIVDIIQVYFNKKRSQDALSASEERFRSAFEHAAIGMGLVSMDGKWLKVNKELCDMVGYTEQELLSLTFQEITHPDDLENDLELLHKTLSGELDYFRIEKRYIHKNGSLVWINLNVSLVRDSDLNPVYFVSQIENITERIESQRKFQDLVEKSVVGVYILQEGKFAYVNPRIIRNSGFTESELLSMPVEEFICKEDWDLVLSKVKARLSGQTDEVRYEVRANTKKGELLWLELFGAKTIYQGAPALIGTMVDITDKKTLQIEREKMLADLVQRNKDLHEFAQIVSHNLRGPLATILGLCNMLKDSRANEEEKDFVLEGIGKSAEKLDAVVRELNNILHVKSSFGEERVSVPLPALVNEIKEKFTNLISLSHAEITCDFTAASAVLTIRSFLYDILFNLISNSLHYRDKSRPPLIKILVDKKPGSVTIFVEDNGIGIDLSKHRDKIFGLNKRFHNTDKGKGLGLFMVKAQVDALNGTIELSSEPGVGTTVKVVLPQ